MTLTRPVRDHLCSYMMEKDEEISRLKAEANIYKTQAEFALSYLDQYGDFPEVVERMRENIRTAPEFSVELAKII